MKPNRMLFARLAGMAQVARVQADAVVKEGLDDASKAAEDLGDEVERAREGLASDDMPAVKRHAGRARNAARNAEEFAGGVHRRIKGSGEDGEGMLVVRLADGQFLGHNGTRVADYADAELFADRGEAEAAAAQNGGGEAVEASTLVATKGLKDILRAARLKAKMRVKADLPADAVISPGWDGRYVLMHEDGGYAREGEVVTSFRGEKAKLEGGRAPQHGGSTGKVWVVEVDDKGFGQREMGPTVYGLAWSKLPDGGAPGEEVPPPTAEDLLKKPAAPTRSHGPRVRTAAGLKAMPAPKGNPKKVGTINLEPYWPGMIRYFHANPDLKWWRQTLANDDNGWFAAVAATHPDAKVKQLGLRSPSFKKDLFEKGAFAGLGPGGKVLTPAEYDALHPEKASGAGVEGAKANPHRRMRWGQGHPEFNPEHEAWEKKHGPTECPKCKTGLKDGICPTCGQDEGLSEGLRDIAKGFGASRHGVRAAESGKNTKLFYMYRDASNYKQHEHAVFEGTMTQEQYDQLLKHSDDGEYFIPQQVGLDSLVSRFGDIEEQEDHPWHELEGFESTDEPATDGPVNQFVARFLAAVWDPIKYDPTTGEE